MEDQVYLYLLVAVCALQLATVVILIVISCRQSSPLLQRRISWQGDLESRRFGSTVPSRPLPSIRYFRKANEYTRFKSAAEDEEHLTEFYQNDRNMTSVPVRGDGVHPVRSDHTYVSVIPRWEEEDEMREGTNRPVKSVSDHLLKVEVQDQEPTADSNADTSYDSDIDTSIDTTADTSIDTTADTSTDTTADTKAGTEAETQAKAVKMLAQEVSKHMTSNSANSQQKLTSHFPRGLGSRADKKSTK